MFKTCTLYALRIRPSVTYPDRRDSALPNPAAPKFGVVWKVERVGAPSVTKRVIVVEGLVDADQPQLLLAA